MSDDDVGEGANLRLAKRLREVMREALRNLPKSTTEQLADAFREYEQRTNAPELRASPPQPGPDIGAAMRKVSAKYRKQIEQAVQDAVDELLDHDPPKT